MGKIKFSDGVTINTDGPYRVEILTDGFYVLGHGMSIPCRDKNEADAELRRLTVGLLAGEEITFCVAALNRMNWEAIGEDPPGVVATEQNLQYFTPKTLAMAVQDIRRYVKPLYLPMVDGILAKLEGKNG